MNSMDEKTLREYAEAKYMDLVLRGQIVYNEDRQEEYIEMLYQENVRSAAMFNRTTKGVS
jgi:hypothetical protein